VHSSGPASLALLKNGEAVFEAQMSAEKTAGNRQVSETEEGWEGPVFLPRVGSASQRGEKLFFARMRGITHRYTFLDPGDAFKISPSSTGPFQALIDSRFVPEQWAVRPDATHAKSKTYKRSQLAALL